MPGMSPTVPREGVEDRGDVATSGTLPDEEEERSIAQPDRSPRLDDLPGIAGQGTETRLRAGEDHAEPALGDAVDPRHVACRRARGYEHAAGPSRGQAVSPAEAPADVAGEALGHGPGEGIVDHQHGPAPPD